MGKSLTATLVGLVVQARRLQARRSGAGARAGGGPAIRAAPIRVRDVMRMSSGLSFTGQDDRRMRSDGQYHDHFFIYAGAVDAFRYATTSAGGVRARTRSAAIATPIR